MEQSGVEKIFVLEDDDVFRKRLSSAFARRGFETLEASGVREGLALIERHCPKFAVLDLCVPDGSGLELLRALVRQVKDVRAVLLTGFGTIATTVEALKEGAVDYLTKPAHAEAILEVLMPTVFEASNGIENKVEQLPLPSLSQVEWDHIQRVLQECGGNVTKASKVLGLHRRSLQRKLAKNPYNLV